MDKKYLKWSIMAISFFLLLAVIGMIFYLLVPWILGLLIDVEDPCAYEPSMTDAGPQGLTSAVYGLCTLSKSFIAVIIMVLLVIAGFMGFINMVLTTIDIFQSKTISAGKKILWIGVMWVILGPILSIAYYFTVKKR